MRGAFIWDDNLLIVQNASIKHLPGLGGIFSQDMGAGSFAPYRYYRPLQQASFALEYAVWGLRPHGYHLGNIVLHILASLCVFALSFFICRNYPAALFASLVFVSHPAQTESVSYISSRGDLLAAFFLLSGVFFYVLSLEGRRAGFWYLLSFCAYGLSLCAKENAVIFLPLIVLYHAAFRKALCLRKAAAFACLTGAYVFLRSLVIPLSFPSPGLILQRVPGFFAACASYLRLLFFPFHLHFAYGDRAFSYGDPQVWCGILLCAILIWFALARRKKDPLFFFAVFWFLAALLPFAGIYPVPAFYMSEHALYIPLFAFALLFARVIGNALSNRKARLIACAAAVLAIVAYGCLSVWQNRTWIDPVRFYERNLRYCPECPELYVNLCNEHTVRGDIGKAIAACRQAIALDRENPAGYFNLGNAFRQAGDAGQAIGFYRQAVEANPAYVQAFNNLVVLLYESGRKKEALLKLAQALSLHPDNPQLLYNAAVLHYHENDREKSVAYYRRAHRLGFRGADPEFESIMQNTP